MIGSLCSGYSGLDMAAAALTGQSLAFVSDIDPGAKRILSHNHPDVPNIGNLTTYDFTPWAGIVRILTAGYPCQPFSHAGKRLGTDDPRHLFPHVARAIGEIRPELVLLENVRGHLSKGFDHVLGALASLGYDARWTVVRASEVGAPHERARLYVAAYPHGGGYGPGPLGRIMGGVDGPDEGTSQERERAWPVPVGGGFETPTDADDSGRGEQWRPLTVPPQLSAPQHVGEDPSRFGPYAAAVARWEAATRPAPDPTVGGRLSAVFVEWMMGLPEGWVTAVPGLSSNAQIKAFGNGIVPQAAFAAYRALGVGA